MMASVVFQRKNGKITKKTFKGGKVVKSEVVQTKKTPKSSRRTTSQLARQEAIMQRTAKSVKKEGGKSEVFTGPEAQEKSKEAFEKAKLEGQKGQSLKTEIKSPKDKVKEVALNQRQQDFAATLSPSERAEYIRQISQRKEQPISTSDLTNRQREFMETLPKEERESYIRSIAQRKYQPVQSFISPEQRKFMETLSKKEQAVYARKIAERKEQPTQQFLTKEQTDFAKSLPEIEKQEFLKQVGERKVQPKKFELNERQSELYRSLTTPVAREVYVQKLKDIEKEREQQTSIISKVPGTKIPQVDFFKLSAPLRSEAKERAAYLEATFFESEMLEKEGKRLPISVEKKQLAELGKFGLAKVGEEVLDVAGLAQYGTEYLTKFGVEKGMEFARGDADFKKDVATGLATASIVLPKIGTGFAKEFESSPLTTGVDIIDITAGLGEITETSLKKGFKKVPSDVILPLGERKIVGDIDIEVLKTPTEIETVGGKFDVRQNIPLPESPEFTQLKFKEKDILRNPVDVELTLSDKSITEIRSGSKGIDVKVVPRKKGKDTFDLGEPVDTKVFETKKILDGEAVQTIKRIEEFKDVPFKSDGKPFKIDLVRKDVAKQTDIATPFIVKERRGLLAERLKIVQRITTDPKEFFREFKVPIFEEPNLAKPKGVKFKEIVSVTEKPEALGISKLEFGEDVAEDFRELLKTTPGEIKDLEKATKISIESPGVTKREFVSLQKGKISPITTETKLFPKGKKAQVSVPELEFEPVQKVSKLGEEALITNKLDIDIPKIDIKKPSVGTEALGVASIEDIFGEQKISPLSELKSPQKTSVFSEVSLEKDIKSFQKIEPLKDLTPIQRVESLSDVRTDQTLETIKVQKIFTPLKAPDTFKPIDEIKRPKLKLEPKFKGKNIFKKEQGYHAYVKQGGKFVKVTDKPLSYNNAYLRGLNVADETTAARVVLKKAGKSAQSPDQPIPYTSPDKFRSPIKKGKKIAVPNTFIEKNKYRIDSRGEREGITAKGLLKLEQIRKEKQKRSRVRPKLKPTNSSLLAGSKPLKLQPKAPSFTKTKSKFRRIKL